jgi:hypothetical protein
MIIWLLVAGHAVCVSRVVTKALLEQQGDSWTQHHFVNICLNTNQFAPLKGAIQLLHTGPITCVAENLSINHMSESQTLSDTFMHFPRFHGCHNTYSTIAAAFPILKCGDTV